MNQIRAFLIEQGITVRKSVAALRTSLGAILENRSSEISLRMRKLFLGLQQDWIWTDKRIEMTTPEIKAVSESEASCQRLMTIPSIGLIISTAVVAAVGTGEAYDHGRDFAAWLGLVPRQQSTGGRTILGREVIDIYARCSCRPHRSS
jgi:transposase